MKVLDLFSGIGGFSLGLERAGFKTVAFCEINEFCHKVLGKNFPGTPIFSDIRTLTSERLNQYGIDQIDVVTGGFPCQPFSTAGKRKSTEDDRDLWPEMFRVIKETRPTWVIGENVANFINLAFTRTKTDLEAIGYTVRPFIIPACAVGAQQNRARVWIIAYLDSAKIREQSVIQQERFREGFPGFPGKKGASPNTDGSGCQRKDAPQSEERNKDGGNLWPCEEKPSSDSYSEGFDREAASTQKEDAERDWESHWWPARASDFGSWFSDQSDMGRVIHGVSDGLDKDRRERVAALGNTVVPQIPEILGRYILSSIYEKRIKYEA